MHFLTTLCYTVVQAECHTKTFLNLQDGQVRREQLYKHQEKKTVRKVETERNVPLLSLTNCIMMSKHHLTPVSLLIPIKTSRRKSI